MFSVGVVGVFSNLELKSILYAKKQLASSASTVQDEIVLSSKVI